MCFLFVLLGNWGGGEKGIINDWVFLSVLRGGCSGVVRYWVRVLIEVVYLL